MPEGFTFEASYDGIRIDVLSSRVQHGRTLVSHRFPKRDGAANEDLGREPFVCSMEFLFLDSRFTSPDAGDYYQRFLDFNNAIGRDEARVLVHPYEGAVRCHVSNFSHRASGDTPEVITASATFTEEIALEPVFVAGAGAQTRAGAQDVRAEAVLAAAELEAIGESTATLDDAIAEAESWEQDLDLSAREVTLRMATINNRLNAELNRLDAYSNLARYPIVKQYTLLQHALRRASESVTSTTTRIVTITVREPIPLRVLAARFYGASEAERRFGEIVELNPGIRNPGLVPPGTELKAYSKATSPRRLVSSA